MKHRNWSRLTGLLTLSLCGLTLLISTTIAQAQGSGLEQRVAAMETAVAALQAENAAQQTQIDGLVAENATQQTQIDGLTTDLATANGQISAL